MSLGTTKDCGNIAIIVIAFTNGGKIQCAKRTSEHSWHYLNFKKKMYIYGGKSF